LSKIGLYGGTFDPIHNGHLIPVQAVFEKRGLDKVVFIPCHISPHKTSVLSSPPESRLEMLKLALKDFENFTYSDFEIEQGNISYSLNTIVEFNKQYKDIELIIGFDNLVVFDKWYKPDEILKYCELIVMKRTVDTYPDNPNKYFEKAKFVETPLIEISSTSIRERIRKGLPITSQVPEQVEQYIHDHKLYF
jgi:nicotinate-nucleotide adenylyltransferase